MFNTIEDLKSYQKYLRPLNENYIYYYLNTIYQYLLIREESQGADINEINSKNLFSNTLKQKANENGISLRNFLQYLDIQEFMCERLFKYLDKTKTGQLTKNEFVNGLDTIYYGNFQELYKLIFFMCDFNENGKLHKFNVALREVIILIRRFKLEESKGRTISNIYLKSALIIPITGFAHSVASSGLDYKKEGPIYGIGSNLLKLAGPVIVYGIVSAVIFGSIRYLGGLL